jgi:hypothetical protein
MRIKIRERKQKKSWVMPALILAIMILSVVGFSFGGSIGGGSSPNTINGYKFIPDQANGVWKVEKDKKEFEFHFLPEDVSHIFVDGNIDYEEYILIDEPEANLSEEALGLIALSKFEANKALIEQDKFVKQGFRSGGSENSYDCEDATAGIAVVVFELGNVSEIVNEDNCIHIRGNTGSEIVRAKERFIYDILGIDSY